MSAKSLFQTLHQQAQLESKCGIPFGKSLVVARDQIRVDLHPQGFSWGRLKTGSWESGGFEITDSYETALRTLQQKVTSQRLLSSGQVLVTNLWPSNVQIQPIHQQVSQKFNNLTELDLTAQVAPSQLNLTAGFLYRAIEKKADRSMLKNGDLIGLPHAGLDSIESTLPPISKFGRYWGALAVLQVMTSRFSMELPESLLLGIIDVHRIHYFSIRKLQLSGLRSSVRSSLRDTSDLHSTITSLGSDTTCLLFVNLTTQTDDLQKISEELEKNKKWTIRTMGRTELLQAFPELQSFSNAPLFPLTLLADRPALTPSDIQNPCFVTPSEAMAPQITSTQGALLQSCRLVKTLAALLTVGFLGFFGHQIFNNLTSPAWKVQPEQAQKTKQQYDQFIQETQEYQKLYSNLISFPRFDRVASPLLETTVEGILIEEIKFSTRPVIKEPHKRTFELTIQGTIKSGELLRVREYAQQLESLLQQELPTFSVVVNDSGLSEKTNGVGAAFRLNVKLEAKPHGSI